MARLCIAATLASLVVLWGADARAQDDHTAHVSLTDLTVDGDPPPERYRDLLATAVRPTVDPVLQCYRDRLRVRPGLEGNLRLRLWVSARRVIRATPEESLPDAELQACAIQHVRTFTLPPEAPEGGATVRFVLRFTTSGEPAAAAPSPAPGTSATAPGASTAPAGSAAPREPTLSERAAELAATLPPEMRARAMELLRAGQGQAAPIRFDTATGGERTPASLAAATPAQTFAACMTVSGDVQLRVTIAADGGIRTSRAGGTVRDRRAITCVHRALQAVRVPAAPAATRATATVTLSAPPTP